MAKWGVEGSIWTGEPNADPNDWNDREFALEIEADNPIEALAIAAHRIALGPREDFHVVNVRSLHVHFGRKRK